MLVQGFGAVQGSEEAPSPSQPALGPLSTASLTVSVTRVESRAPTTWKLHVRSYLTRQVNLGRRTEQVARTQIGALSTRSEAQPHLRFTEVADGGLRGGAASACAGFTVEL